MRIYDNDFMQENHDTAFPKTHSIYCYYWIYRKLHKKLYKPFSKKAMKC